MTGENGMYRLLRRKRKRKIKRTKDNASEILTTSRVSFSFTSTSKKDSEPFVSHDMRFLMKAVNRDHKIRRRLIYFFKEIHDELCSQALRIKAFNNK